MLKNYLLVAYRNFQRNQFYSIANVIGLAIAIAASLLIFLYIQNELTYDQAHPHHKQIYRVASEINIDDKLTKVAATAPEVPLFLPQAFPEIENITRILPTEGCILSYQDNNMYEYNVLFADNNYFDIFSHHFIQGEAKNALIQPNSIVLTKKFAKKIFGEEDAIGKEIMLSSINAFNLQGNYIVTGILEDFDSNTHLNFNALISWKPTYSWVYTYFLLNEKADIEHLYKKWDGFFQKYLSENYNSVQPIFQPISSIHLHSQLQWEFRKNGNLQYLQILGAVAIFIILIACINYINLATTKASTRIKEVGIRKILGAERKDLIIQLLVETAFSTTAAFLLALGILENILPYFNQILGLGLYIHFTENILFVVIIVSAYLFITLLAGLYPAWYLASFPKIEALKGYFKLSYQNFSLKKILITIQFTIAVVTVIGAGIIHQQLNYLIHKDLGLTKNNILVIRLPQDSVMRQKLPLLKKELLKEPSIFKVGSALDIPGDNLLGKMPFVIQAGENTKEVLLSRIYLQDDFLATLEITLVQGHNLNRNIDDYKQAYLINETAAKFLQWENPIGKKIMTEINAEGIPTRSGQVIGVVKDFHFNSLHTEIPPIVMMFTNRPGKLFLNIDKENMRHVIAFVKSTWGNLKIDFPFNYFLLDTNFQNHYDSEKNLSMIINWFSILIVLLANVGLFALAAFNAESRTKEIGIRKVLGAKESTLIILLSKDFIKYILIAMLAAYPIAYIIIKYWLQSFAYHISISWWVLLICSIIVFITSILPIFIQNIRIISLKPIKTLRND